jgi:hypothetical protein
MDILNVLLVLAGAVIIFMAIEIFRGSKEDFIRETLVVTEEDIDIIMSLHSLSKVYDSISDKKLYDKNRTEMVKRLSESGYKGYPYDPTMYEYIVKES